MTAIADPASASLRIDKLLWYLRLAPTRSAAQLLIATGHVRLDGRRVDRASTMVRTGSVLVLPRGNSAIVVRIVQLPHRRGPAAEARLCYHLGPGDVDMTSTTTLVA